MKRHILLVLLALITTKILGADLLVEAESFSDKGGWVTDQQFIESMGSPYLLAHGMGVPVADARTQVTFPEKGTYYVYVRTYNWVSPWFEGEGPGKFVVQVNGKRLPVCGSKGKEWMWQEAGSVSVSKLQAQLSLHDLTGFDGRVDALYFTTEKGAMPPSDISTLSGFRRKCLGLPDVAPSAGTFDLVVVGGGVAGICAAVSAARLGMKVALIHNRPVLGGNNSSEVRVHLGGRIETGIYPNLGNLIKEFGPKAGGNAKPASQYEDEKKARLVANEQNIQLFTNYHVISVEMDGSRIRSVVAKHIESGEEKSFSAPLFSDCTGDGNVGFLAGADYRMGRESRDEYKEKTAPEVSDDMTMGASVQWYSVEHDSRTNFPLFRYGLDFNEQSCQKVPMGEWTWETGMNYDQITQFERIRDYGLMVVYSNWSCLKNTIAERNEYARRSLDWVAYIAGKRESRRLLGDYVLKEGDITTYNLQEDASCATTWSIDLHYPDPENTKYFPGNEFKAICKQETIYPYPIPYRCLYSRNINNLFMAGRNISVTHVALGTVRVMRTTGMMGEVVGMAASLCKKHNVEPRTIYWKYFPEMKALMKEGVGKKDLPNNQTYNMGGSKEHKP